MAGPQHDYYEVLGAPYSTGTTLRLKSKGLLKFGGHGRGDLNRCPGLRIPDNISEEERHIHEQLRKLNS